MIARPDPVVAITTSHGFTGHEHLDKVGLIHMNGRVYDPSLGRFLSADPTIQFPDTTQGLNRYSYVNNNPLSYTDPSGYFLKGLFRSIRKAFRQILAIAVASIPGINVIAAGFIAGLITGGDLKSGIIGALTAGAFGQLHNLKFGIGKILAHGLVGGVSSVAQGGKFGPGFLSAGFTQALSPAINKINPDITGPNFGRTIAAAIAGGAASVLGGGKFVNGAITGAFGRLFNDDNIGGDTITENTYSDGTTTIHRIDFEGEVVATLNLKVNVTLRTESFRDQLLDLSQYAGGRVIDVISGYRSQASQDAERAAGNPRAARISQHTTGVAADFKISGSSAVQAADIAFNSRIFNRVNLYTSSRSIHVDQRSGYSGYFGIDWAKQN